MSDLLILGIYPHAVEMAEIVARINRVEHTWNLVGFVSAYGDKVDEKLIGLPVFGWEDALTRYPTAALVPEYDWPCKPDIPRQRLTSLIDPSAFVSKTARIGLGGAIYPNCYVGAYALIGDFLFCLSGGLINPTDVFEDTGTLTTAALTSREPHVAADCYLGQSSSVR